MAVRRWTFHRKGVDLNSRIKAMRYCAALSTGSMVSQEVYVQNEIWRQRNTMSYLSAILIFIICILLAVAVCAPLIYIARRLRRRRTARENTALIRKMPMPQAIPSFLLVVVLFLAFAYPYIAPDSWLGARVATGEGRFWLSILVFLLFAAINYLWIDLKSRRAKPDQTNQSLKSKPGADSDGDH
jgi:ABC-type dipeptide/oligopeptide/nickel transport system permease component